MKNATAVLLVLAGVLAGYFLSPRTADAAATESGSGAGRFQLFSTDVDAMTRGGMVKMRYVFKLDTATGKTSSFSVGQLPEGTTYEHFSPVRED